MERIVPVVPEDGLHARPASAFVSTAGEFDAEITVAPADGEKEPVRGDSMLAVTGLAVTGGEQVRITAEGPDAEAALDALETLLGKPAEEIDD